MRKKTWFKKAAASTLAVCMLGSAVLSGTAPKEVYAADSADAEWEELQSLISNYYGEWNTPSYPGQTTNLMPDTALMGNGDIGVNSGGDAAKKTFYISKGDFWEYNGQQKAVGGYSITKKPVEKQNPNIAPNYKTVTSTPEDTWGLAVLGKEKAFSGKIEVNPTGYGWVSKPITDGSPQWIQAEYEEPITVKKYVLYSDGGIRPNEARCNSRDFQLQYSNDGVNWEVADDVTGNAEGVYTKVLDEAVTAKYFRMYITNPVQPGFSGDIRAKVVQLEFYATDAEEPSGGNDGNTEEAKFYEKQDILNAKVETDMPFDGDLVSMETFTSATENTVVTKLTSHATETLSLQTELWSKSGDGNRPVNAVVNEDGTVTVTRKTYNGNPAAEKSYTSEVAMTTKVVGADAVADVTKNAGLLTFDIEPEETVYLVTAVGGGGQTYNGAGELKTAEPVQESKEVLAESDTEGEIQTLWDAHQSWWKDYWMTSHIKLDTSDENLDTVMEYYYGAQYILGCTAREGELAPGIMGIWCTVDNLKWWGHYQLNYNFNAPFYGAYSSNRPELGAVAFEQILEYEEQGRKNSEDVNQLLRLSTDGAGAGNGYVQKMIAEGKISNENGIPGGLFYPVGITPWGQSMCPNLFHNETLCAAYSAQPGIEYYRYTMDEDYLREKLYPYLKACAKFYETWLEHDEETGQYNMYAGKHENAWSYNPAVELTTVYYLFEALVEASETLDLDPKERELWIDIRDNLAEQPVADYNGKKVYSLAEKDWMGGDNYGDLVNPVPADGNMIPLESFAQSPRYGYFSDAETLEISRNTIDVFDKVDGWSGGNNFPRLFKVAVISRYDIDKIVSNLARVIEANMKPNLRIADAWHGIEKSGATQAINSMMMLTDDGITKLFPNWYTGKDAEFARLRAEGAFIVSAKYEGLTQEVKDVTITSEAGKTMTLVSPWDTGAIVKDSKGNVVETKEGTVPNWKEEMTITFDTVKGETYTVERNGEIPAKVRLDKNTLDADLGKVYQLNATTYPEGEKVFWSSSNPEVASVTADGKVLALKEGTADITAALENGQKASCAVTVTTAATFIKAKEAQAGSSYKGMSAQDLINNSGMSGTDSFEDTHIADSVAKGMWHSESNPGANAWINVDLGDVYSLDELWIWNGNQTNLKDRGFKNVKIEYSIDGETWSELTTDMTFEGQNTAYPFQFAQAPQANVAIKATNLNDGKNSPVSFAGAEARYVRLTAAPDKGDGDWGNDYYSLSELRFTEMKAGVDKDALNSLIAQAEELAKNLDNYTEETANALTEALTTAKAVAKNETASEEMVKLVEEMLQNAINNLEGIKEEVDKNELSALINYALSQQENEDYANVLPIVKAEFEKALAEAIAVNEKADATQEEVDAAYAKLLEMVHMLSFIKGDTTDLQTLVDVINGLDKEIYTPESWEKVAEALAAAEEVLANENAMQEEIDAAREALQAAYDALVKAPVDKTKLQQLVDESKKYEDAIKEYTPSTADNFTKALEDARNVLANDEASQKEVDAAYATLQNAIFGLRFIPNKDKLDELIKAAEKVDTSKYTAETVATFKAALENAKAVFADGNATEEDVANAEKALKDAQDNLVEKTDGSEGGNKPDDGDKTDNGTVQTGDTTNVAMTFMTMLMAMFAAVGVVFVRRKRR